MRNITYILLSILISLAIFGTSCNSGKLKNVKELSDSTSVIGNETEALLNLFEKSGNFINQKKIPTMIPVKEVVAHKKDYLVLDIRSNSDYISGHLDGAVNVPAKKLFNYMKNEVATGAYKKVVLVCKTNHKASFNAMLFRLLGYSNVYSMKWGMSSCDKKVAQAKWMSGVSNKYASQLEKKGNSKNKKGAYPTLKTGKANAYKILEDRVKTVIENSKFIIKADEVFADPSKYYIINYWKLDHYVKGHIPGAIQYNPKKSLTRDTELATLPTNKTIVVYCYTGQHASFVTAYLQVLGYDAKVLLYSANAFMHSALTSLEIGHAYDAKKHFTEIPLVTGNKPSIETEATTSEETVEDDATPAIIIKKEEKEEEGGC